MGHHDDGGVVWKTRDHSLTVGLRSGTRCLVSMRRLYLRTGQLIVGWPHRKRCARTSMVRVVRSCVLGAFA